MKDLDYCQITPQVLRHVFWVTETPQTSTFRAVRGCVWGPVGKLRGVTCEWLEERDRAMCTWPLSSLGALRKLPFGELFTLCKTERGQGLTEVCLKAPLQS